jgi:GPH family glycoside/pentoside/hexuronide:cation symporter
MEEAISQSNPDRKEKIGLGEKLAYGCGDAACNLVWASLTAFIVFFFTDVAGIPPAIAGVILLVGRVFDGSDDILAGALVDRTKSRFGKARPWLLWLALPFGILTVMMYSVPNFSQTGKIIYFAIVYLLINDVYSFINIPYGTLNAMITQDQYQRSVLSIYRMIMAVIASVFVSVGTTGFVEALGGDAPAWQKIFIIYAVFAVILFMITFLFTKERVKSLDSDKSKSNVPFGVSFKAMLKNHYLWIIIAAMILAFISQGLSGATIYFAQYILGDVQLMALLQLAIFIPMLVGMLTIAPLVKRFGKQKCVLVGATLMVIGSFFIVINPESLPVVIIGLVIKSIGGAPVAAVGFAMVLDTIEYGDWKTGIRSEGLVSSMASLATKVGTGIGSALIGWILAAGSYIAGAAIQGSSAVRAIQMCFIYIPAFLAILIVVLLWFFKLDEVYPKIMQELHERDQSKALHAD